MFTNPTNFSNQWLEFWNVMVFQVKLPHIPQVLDGKSPHTGKLGLQIRRKLLHDRLSPSFSFLPFRNHPAYVPVKANQFLVHRLDRGILSGSVS